MNQDPTEAARGEFGEREKLFLSRVRDWESKTGLKWEKEKKKETFSIESERAKLVFSLSYKVKLWKMSENWSNGEWMRWSLSVTRPAGYPSDHQADCPFHGIPSEKCKMKKRQLREFFGRKVLSQWDTVIGTQTWCDVKNENEEWCPMVPPRLSPGSLLL